MTCTNRPAGQTWYLDAECHYPLGDPELIGNQITGNGTSAGTYRFGNRARARSTRNVPCL